MDAIKVKLIGLSRGGGGNLQPDKTVTPTEQEQTVRPDPGYDGLRQVTVEAIPDQFPDVSDTTATPETVLLGRIFYGSDGERKVGEYQSVDTLAQYFADTLTDIEDSSVTALIPSFFEGKTALRSVDFENLQSIGDRAFFGCANLETVDAPNLRLIGISAFEMCVRLNSFVHGLVVTISDRAFYNALKLASLDMPNLTRVGASAFQGCTALTSLDMPNLTSVGVNAFDGHSCTSISLPELHTDGRYAVRSSTLLDLDIGKIVTLSGANLFNGCPNLRKVKADYVETFTHYYNAGPFEGYPFLQMLDFPRLTTMSVGSFRNSSSLSVLILRADSVCTMPNINAFAGTPFAANGSGGTLYCPQALISQYEQATNWSVILAYPYNQILPIEGSTYEVMTDG